jgi:lambda family phage portal protein
MEETSLLGYSTKGYGAAVASHSKRALKGFKAMSGSPKEDIDYNNYTLRQRGRMLYMSAPIATSAVKTNRTNTIGLGLKLNPRIDYNLLGISKETAKEWEARTKAEFRLWATKKENCDAIGVNDFYAMQQLAFNSWLMSGDVFGLIKWKKTTLLNPYALRIHIIEADRCSTPSNAGGYVFAQTEGKAKNGNRIHDGVEVDANGGIVAYYIRNTYPYELTMDVTQWVRVAAMDEKTGLPNVIHVMNSERPDQYRGVTYLAPVIEAILQIRRYSESELTAAIVESFFTAFVTTEAKKEDVPFNDVKPEDTVDLDEDDNEYSMGPGQMNIMKPGENITFADPKRPAGGFEAFVKAICTQIGAATEIPRDLLLKEFNASYSASRAALLEAWKAFKMYREWFTSDFCQPIYEIWLSEAVARGRINASGFFRDPLIHQAWLGAEWIGPSQGQLDPVKEVTAEIMAISEGFTTREDSAVRINGSDWNSNVDQLLAETDKMNQINQAKADNSQVVNSTNINMGDTIRSVIKDAIKEILEEQNEAKKRENI